MTDLTANQSGMNKRCKSKREREKEESNPDEGPWADGSSDVQNQRNTISGRFGKCVAELK